MLQQPLFSDAAGTFARSPVARRGLISSPLARSPVKSRFAVPPLDLAAEVAPEAPRLASNLQTAFNLVNNYVGMVLLSMTFCFARCGWLALPLLALLTGFGSFTGALMIDCYVLIVAEGASVPSYAEIGSRCMGEFGKWLVIVSSVVETVFAILCAPHAPALERAHTRPARRA